MELLYEKILFLFMLFFLGYIAGAVPYLLRERCFSPSRFRDDLVSFFNCFSAGVFFATFFMHMMPEAQEEFEAVFGKDTTYPFAELLVSLGFFFVMFVEQLVMAWYAKKNEPGTDETSASKTEESTFSSLNNNKSSYQTMDESKSTTAFRRIESTSTTVTQITCCYDESPAKQKPCSGIEMNGIVRCHSNSDISKNECENGLRDEDHSHFDVSSHVTIKAFVLLFALSTHALFEGMAIGFQSTTSSLRSLVIAVAIHKMALSFSYGISVVNNKASCTVVFLSLLIFSIMAPIGIGIGAGLTHAKNANATVEMVVAVMQAFASGTFVYVIFIEILPREFVSSNSDNKLKKVFSLAAGFALMSALQAVPHEEE